MATDLAKISDAQAVADKLAKLPKDALLYIAGYVISIHTTRVGGDSKNTQRNQILPTAYLSTFTNLLRC